jgi:hypothetical protein
MICINEMSYSSHGGTGKHYRYLPSPGQDLNQVPPHTHITFATSELTCFI